MKQRACSIFGVDANNRMFRLINDRREKLKMIIQPIPGRVSKDCGIAAKRPLDRISLTSE